MGSSDLDALRRGLVIPAHPLALDEGRRLDERRQRALTRYYAAAGAGGIAVGVHTTQFEIHEPAVGLLRPVLELASETARACEATTGRRLFRVAGVCGETGPAVDEAGVARELGYDAGLLSLAALPKATNAELLAHCRAVGEVLPLFGFYLQPAAGGRVLDFDFWRRFAELPAVMAIKIAPFDRYRTRDVVRAVAASGRCDEIALYTGNDDHILLDLLTEHRVVTAGGERRLRMTGGLLGQWAVGTRRAVELLDAIHAVHAADGAPPRGLLARAEELTEVNAAIFDAPHDYAGCIPGIHEVLRRQGLLDSIVCLDPRLALSPGQAEEIDRVCTAYPHLFDDELVAEHLDEWLA